MTFEDALKQVKQGNTIRLPHWSQDVCIKLQLPHEQSDMTHPYLYVESRYGRSVWNSTVPEQFSEKWEIIKG